MATYKVTLQGMCYRPVLVKADSAEDAADLAQAEPEKQEWWGDGWEIDDSNQSLSVVDTEEWDATEDDGA